MSLDIIAEIGSCHDGQLDKAIALAGAAVDAGATTVKLQYWSSTPRMVARRQAPELADAYEKYRLPATWLPLLKTAVRALGAKFACTVYLPEDVDLVALDVDVLKVASFEANDPVLLAALRRPLAAGKDIVISYGMGASRSPVQQFLLRPVDAFGAVERDVAVRERVRSLYCVSAYPAPLDQLQLARFEAIDNWSDIRARQAYDGVSDHSDGAETIVGALAVARGATVLERHVRLDETALDNPDYAHAMAPAPFAAYVALAKKAESACAGGADGPLPCEESLLGYRVL